MLVVQCMQRKRITSARHLNSIGLGQSRRIVAVISCDPLWQLQAGSTGNQGGTTCSNLRRVSNVKTPQLVGKIRTAFRSRAARLTHCMETLIL